MANIILVTGGARSGKSSFAEQYTLNLRNDAGLQAIYIATSEPFDTEMQARIAIHQQRRGKDWLAIEEPLELSDILLQTDNPHHQPRLVDCLSLWLNNLIYYGRDVDAEITKLVETCSQLQADIVFVTNEIGSGVVPENAETRQFRDRAGMLNQVIAKNASEVYLTVSGIAVKIKPSAP